MSGQKDIAELRRAFFGSPADDAATFYATVEAVDPVAHTCTVEADGIPYDDVLLHAVADAEKRGVYFVPAVGSTVLVSRIGGSNELLVSMFSEVDRVLLTIGDKVQAEMDAETLIYRNDQVELKITGAEVLIRSDTVTLKASEITADADRITLNGGDNNGLVNIEQLKSNLDSLKSYVEAMHGALPAAFSAVGAAMAANGALGKTTYDGAMAGKTITIEEMEDTKVTH